MCTPSNSKRGFTVLVVAASVVAMIGMTGLAFDLGRAFISKSELQVFADTAAMAACSFMDGTRTGIQAANGVGLTGPIGGTKKANPPNWTNNWKLDSAAVPTVTTGYATTFAGTYDSYATASGPATNTYRFITVTATAPLPITLLTIVPGIGNLMTITATATAGQKASGSSGPSGLIPFSPAAHNPADTKNFGYVVDQIYTLKWGNGSTTNCPGDAGFNPGNASANHGFIDLGQGNSNSAIRQAIEYGTYPPGSPPVSAGMTVPAVPGNRGSSIFGALQIRSNQDPDQTNRTWTAYKAAGIGDYRRVVTVAVHDPALPDYYIDGFANFLLDIASNIVGNSGPVCATYIGPGDLTGYGTGGVDGTKIYSNMLYR